MQPSTELSKNEERKRIREGEAKAQKKQAIK